MEVNFYWNQYQKQSRIQTKSTLESKFQSFQTQINPTKAIQINTRSQGQSNIIIKIIKIDMHSKWFISLNLFKNNQQALQIKMLTLIKKRVIAFGFSTTTLKLPKDPSKSYDSILITSALPYVNNVPHLGNVIGSVLSADVFARYNRSLGNNTLFVCGTDQYGTATEVKALKEKQTPQQICDRFHQIHKKVYEWFNISFDHFGRTSSQTHKKIVQQIFLDLDKNGFISEKQSQQHHCKSCNLYLADRFIRGICPKCGNTEAKGDQCQSCNKLITPTELKNPQCLVCGSQPQIRSTKHLYIKTGQLKNQLSQWLSTSINQGRWSNNARSITNQWVDNLISERSISRDLKWGVPIPKPDFQNKVFYVWFDAPIGYISLTAQHLPQSYKKWWNKQSNVKLCQFMGKDNVPFHSIIFPATLLGTKKPWKLVNTISATQYLQYQGTKFSKSAETGIFCDAIYNLDIDVSAWRYYLLYNRPERFDRNFEWSDFFDVVNRDLMNNIGNLFQRVLTLACGKLKGKRIQLKETTLRKYQKQFLDIAQQLFGGYILAMNNIELKQGLTKLIQVSSLANKYLQDMAPWTRTSIQNGSSQIVIEVLLNYLKLMSVMMQPFVPNLSKKAQQHLGLEEPYSLNNLTLEYYTKQDFKTKLLNGIPKTSVLKKPSTFVNPLKIADIQIYKSKFGGNKTT